MASKAGLMYDDFSLAEDHLLDQGLATGTMGGADGTVSLTHSGLVLAERLLGSGDEVLDDAAEEPAVASRPRGLKLNDSVPLWRSNLRRPHLL